MPFCVVAPGVLGSQVKPVPPTCVQVMDSPLSVVSASATTIEKPAVRVPPLRSWMSDSVTLVRPPETV